MSAISTKPESAVVSPVAFSLSTISAKAVLAVTGVLLIGFLLAHLAGNLLIFKGQDSLNAYAQFLKSQGPVLWVARLGLLAVFVLHLGMALQLAKRKREARPQKYVFEKTIQASVASRYMLHTGIIILLFLLLHLAHYTLGLVGTANGSNYLELLDKEGRHDVYRMVIAGF
nr:hypothetical protein [Gemmatales bacterium]